MPGPAVRLITSLALAAVLVVPTGCGPDAEPDLADQVHSFALALGVDPLDRQAIDRLGRHDLVVVDGETTRPSEVAALQRRGARVLAYLSVGTVEPYRPWYAEARDRGWLLERWDRWDEWYADVAQPGLRALLRRRAARELLSGFDGLFLDNTDMVATHPDQAAGMRRLVADLDALIGPDRILMAQNGDETVDQIAAHLDGWNREDVTATFDADRDRYGRVPVDEASAARATLRRLHRRGILVTTTDYVRADDGATSFAATVHACAAGAVPYVADIGLRRVPPRPLVCP